MSLFDDDDTYRAPATYVPSPLSLTHSLSLSHSLSLTLALS